MSFLAQLRKIGGNGSTRTDRRDVARRRSVPQIEPLEQKQLLSGIYHNLATSVLRIDGSSNADTARVTLNLRSSSPFDDEIVVNLTAGSSRQTRTIPLYQMIGPELSRVVNLVEFRGYAGNDNFRNDTYLPSFADGGQGDDVLYGGSNNDTLYGGGGTDRLYGRELNDRLDGGVPGVRVYADNTGDDLLDGGPGDDILNASDFGDNRLYGGPDNDRLYGWQGDDYLNGGSGNDRLQGYTGSDYLYGDSGNDTYVFHPASAGFEVDRISEYSGGGRDRLDFSALGSTDPVSVDLTSSTALAVSTNRRVETRYSYQPQYIEDVVGGAGNDTIYGNAAANMLDGGAGDDGLFGGAGNDTLRGRSGDDRFLFQAGDSTDRASNDALITFVNAASQSVSLTGFGTVAFAAGSWTDAEIIRVDTALANLHAETGNTRLLKQANGANLTFSRVGNQLTTLPNNAQIGGWNSGTTLSFTNNTLGTNMSLWRTVYHELGHNWDDTSENAYAGAFRSLSGWVQSPTRPSSSHLASRAPGDAWWYLNTALFARPDTFGTTDSYSRWNPFEDFATTWETYFLNRYHGTTNGNNLVVAKQNNLGRLFNDLRLLT